MKQVKEIIKKFTRKNLPDIHPGDTVKVHEKIQEGDKERIQVFEGVVLGKKHGSEMGATITVRKVSKGVAVERIFPLHSPSIKKIEIVKRSKVKRSKLYYLREAKGKRARLKRKEFDKEKANKYAELEENKKEKPEKKKAKEESKKEKKSEETKKTKEKEDKPKKENKES